MSHIGRPVHGHLIGSDVAPALPVPIFDDGDETSGGGNAITLASNERLTITSFIITSVGAITITLYLSDDNDGSVETGEAMFSGAFAALGMIAQTGLNVQGAAGADLRVLGSAGDLVSVSFTGFITRA